MDLCGERCSLAGGEISPRLHKIDSMRVEDVRRSASRATGGELTTRKEDDLVYRNASAQRSTCVACCEMRGKLLNGRVESSWGGRDVVVRGQKATRSGHLVLA